MKRAAEKDASLREAALRAMENAYAPYSNFRVGAALRAKDGQVITGCNMENSAFGLAICAETLAVAYAVSQGLTEFDEMAIATEDTEPTPPCGACRQILWEFGGDLEIILCNLEREAGRYRLKDLLPLPFDQRLLGKLNSPS